jgi:hypothetical protein
VPVVDPERREALEPKRLDPASVRRDDRELGELERGPRDRRGDRRRRRRDREEADRERGDADDEDQLA